MRKLLVASQKGGVGKTTTSINLATATAMAGGRVLLLDVDPLSSISSSLNLAEHPKRFSLRATGIDLPGVLICGVLPGLDLLSPYDDGGCTDQDLDDLLKVLHSPEVQATYSCLIVNTPPFMGANPGQLLAAVEEYILVMSAEPMAYRTLPAFLELLQRSKRENPVEMKGIVLTLPDGEQPGGRWERELRGRFGGRIFPQVVPFDPDVEKALACGQVVASAFPESPAASTYHSLVETLALNADADSAQAAASSPLISVATSMRSAGSFGRKTNKIAKLPSKADTGSGERLLGPSQEIDHLLSEFDQDDLDGDDGPVFRSLPEMDLSDDLVVELPTNGPTPLPSGKVRTSPRAAVQVQPGNQLSTRALLVSVALAVVFGVALRFVQMPDAWLPYIAPVSVGLAVTAGIILLLRLIVVAGEASEAQAAKQQIPNRAEPTTPSVKAQSGQMRKLPPRPEPKKDSRSRLAALARQRRNGR